MRTDLGEIKTGLSFLDKSLRVKLIQEATTIKTAV